MAHMTSRSPIRAHNEALLATASAALARYPRETLARTPTPVDELSRLSSQLGPKILMKRDDLTGLALGGDKPRKLEYELGQARAAGADTVVTCGSAQSNHARLTAAAARALGMNVVVVLSRDRYTAFQGNLLTVYLFGADVRIVDTEDHWELEAPALQVCEELREQGARPHYVPVSGTTPHSCLGYVQGGFELAAQITQMDLCPTAIYTPFGTGGIFTSTLLALRLCGLSTPMVGISVNRNQQTCLDNVMRWNGELRRLLDLTEPLPLHDYTIDDTFIGAEYGDPTEAALDAIMLVARTEGILLDPVYTGKVAAGLLAHINAGRWSSDDRLLLVHSGGVPALFAYSEPIAMHLTRRGIDLTGLHSTNR